MGNAVCNERMGVKDRYAPILQVYLAALGHNNAGDQLRQPILLSPVLHLSAVRACVVDCSFTPAPAKKGIQKAASFSMRLGAE